MADTAAYIEVARLRIWHEVSGTRQPDSTLEQDLASPDALGFVRDGYARVNPDGGEQFRVVHAKTVQMILTEPEIDLGSLAEVDVPALVLQGDRDQATLEHSQQVVTTLPDARLAVLPGTAALPLESPEVVDPLVLQFLRGGPRPAW